MTREDEQSLVKRPEINLAQLSKGGLIVGAEGAIQGSLMAVSGMALERITRERIGIPPSFRLPERAVYLMDPSTRRLVMISNREDMGRGPERAGLFAEIVELDEEGNPHYRLSTSEVILSSDTYQFVAVGQNKHGFPPSHIELVEEDQLIKDEEEKAKKERFVSWNEHLANLQLWMNEVNATPEESLDTFIERFRTLRIERQTQAQGMIDASFPQGWQGFSPNVVPINAIIGDSKNQEMLARASFEAGLYPVFWDLKKIIESLMELKEKPDSLQSLGKYWKLHGDCKISSYKILSHSPYTAAAMSPYSPAVMTFDETAEDRLDHDFIVKAAHTPVHNRLATITPKVQKNNTIFSVVEVWSGPDPDEEPLEEEEPWKETHGLYGVKLDEEIYRKLLLKLKADLLLTMFVRGGAPIVK